MGETCYADCTGCPAALVGTHAPTTSPAPSLPPYSAAPFAAGDCQAFRNTINFGYYQSWAIWRSSDCNPLQANAIQVASFGYTHLAFAFAGISASGYIEAYNGDTSFYYQYSQFNSLKTSNPGLKTLIAVGGWTFDQTRFSFVSSSATLRSNFANSVVTFLETHGFDGIDLGMTRLHKRTRILMGFTCVFQSFFHTSIS